MTKSVQSTLLLGQFFMILALEMTNPFLPLLITTQGHVAVDDRVFYSTLSFILPMMANILAAPFWGRVADRFGYKPMLLRACWALVVTQASMLCVHSVEGILVIRILQGAFAGFIVAMQTYALSLCEWHSKGRQLSRLQSTKAIATAIAGFVGGIILTFTDYQGLYGIASLVCLSITLQMQFHLPPSTKNNVPHRPATSSSLSGSRSLFYLLCFLISLTQIAKFLPDPGFSLYLNHSLTDNLMMIGLLYSMPAVGMLLSSEWCGRQFDRCRNHPEQVNRYLIGYSVLGMVLMIIQACISNFVLFVAIRILWGVVLAALLPALFALCSDRAVLPGYALGIANSFAKTGNLIGLLLGGLLADSLSYPLIFLVIAAVYGLFALSLLLFQVASPVHIQDESRAYGDATT